jgi:hypothetical protein
MPLPVARPMPGGSPIQAGTGRVCPPPLHPARVWMPMTRTDNDLGGGIILSLAVSKSPVPHGRGSGQDEKAPIRSGRGPKPSPVLSVG